jgi:hypothetical protein
MIGEVTSNEQNNGNALPVKAKRSGLGSLSFDRMGNCADGLQNRTLTRTERKVLEVILTQDNRNKTQEVIAKSAGCSRTMYLKIMADPWFQEQRRNLLRTMIQEQAGAFVQAAVETATTPGRDGFQDRRLLLTLSGDHVERRQHEHQVTGQVVVGVIGVSMDELG